MFWGEKHTFGYQDIDIFADVGISQGIQNSDNFSGFCSLEFDNFMKHLAIISDENVNSNSLASHKIK